MLSNALCSNLEDARAQQNLHKRFEPNFRDRQWPTS